MTYQELINNILYTVLTVIVPLVVAYIANFLKVKIEESTAIKEATKSEEMDRLVKDALKNVTDAVVAVNQTYTDALKRQGKFDDEAQAYAYNLAYEQALETISSASKEAIKELYGDIDKWLDIKIEAAVREAKK